MQMGENGERKRGCVVVKCLPKNVVRWEGRRVETKNGVFHQKPSVEKKKIWVSHGGGGYRHEKMSGWRKYGIGGEREGKKEVKEKKRIKNKIKVK